MPIQVNLDRLLEQRQMTLSELSLWVDITLANLGIVKTSKARATRFSTLDSVCRALNCQPEDVLERTESVSDAEEG